ncbi:MAG TPA: tetratricopeptide repeat protein [Candidatus Acidoferrales bacterium]|nr:tetratricopeptide repeat protein [Candidatus Acidoferrales bacterium]
MYRGLCKAFANFLILLVGAGSFACSVPKWYFGRGGKYNQAIIELGRGRGGNIDQAIVNLEEIARQDPTYRDTLTQLGRAYYKKGRYDDAFLILQRAVALNKDDEIAWLVLGLTQFQLGDDKRGLDSVRGGLTLLSKNNGDGYRGYPRWDQGGRVKRAISRAVFEARKGSENKTALIGSVEKLLAVIDHEDFVRRNRSEFEYMEEYQ